MGSEEGFQQQESNDLIRHFSHYFEHSMKIYTKKRIEANRPVKGLYEFLGRYIKLGSYIKLGR